MSGNRWLEKLAENPEHSRWYVERFRTMEAEGADLHGEARLIDAMASRGARILDAGCGPGRTGGYLHRMGHEVVGVDLDPVLIAAAEEDHPGPTWLVGDLSELDLPARGVAADFELIVSAGNVMAFLDPATRRGLSQLIQGFAGIYSGRGKDANQTYRYFPATLTATDRLLKELGRDQALLTRLLVDGSRVVDAVAQERDRLSSAVVNTGNAMAAIAAENSAFGRSLELLPPTLREANTTFVNLRAALDDLDPLVATSKEATRNLEPFLTQLGPFARRSVPVFTNLARAVNRPGADNDLADLARNATVLHRRGEPASRASVRAMDSSQEMVSVARAYSPDLTGAISRLSAVTGYYDANGNYARAAASSINLFERDPVNGNLIPTTPAEKFDSLDFDSPSRRCPGGAIQAIAGSNPFLDQGRLGLGTCDPGDLPPG